MAAQSRRFATSPLGIATWVASGVAVVVLLAVFPETVGTLLLALLGIGVYILPSVITMFRSCVSAPGIVLVNLLLGATVIGWVAALAWSLAGKTPKQQWEEEHRRAALYAHYARMQPPPPTR